MLLMIKSFIIFIFKSPFTFFWLGRDFFRSIYYLWRYKFKGWGLHVYVGRFGSGKTSSIVRDVYVLCKTYKQLTVVTNLELKNFPTWTEIRKYQTANDILLAPKNTIVLIDEIGTIFNSRDFSTGEKAIPKPLFQHLVQVRKKKMMIYATVQDYKFLDKQLRDIAATVRVCKMWPEYPYSRYSTVKVFDAHEYESSYNNPLIPLSPMTSYSYIQTDELRKLYDTEELIKDIMKMKYISDKEILENQGEIPAGMQAVLYNKKGKKVSVK